MPRNTKMSTYVPSVGTTTANAEKTDAPGNRRSRTILVIRIAITASLNASRRVLFIPDQMRWQHVGEGTRRTAKGQDQKRAQLTLNVDEEEACSTSGTRTPLSTAWTSGRMLTATATASATSAVSATVCRI